MKATARILSRILMETEFEEKPFESGMIKAIEQLTNRGIKESDIFLTMERSMHCAIGHCGHCQLGPLFVCKDGPVFRYDTVKALFQHQGL